MVESLHPEFSFLPRKFKIALTGAPSDRAAIKFHDIGLRAVRNGAGEIGWEVWVGGGLGRTPMIAKLINAYVSNTETLLAPTLRGKSASCGSTTATDGATTSSRHASRFWCTRKASKPSRRRSRQEFAESPRRRADPPCAAGRDFPTASRATSPVAAFPRPTAGGPHRCGARRKSSIRPMAAASREQSQRASRAGLSQHHHFPAKARSASRRAMPATEQDGGRCRPRRDAGYSFDELRVTHEQNLVLPHGLAIARPLRAAPA